VFFARSEYDNDNGALSDRASKLYDSIRRFSTPGWYRNAFNRLGTTLTLAWRPIHSSRLSVFEWCDTFNNANIEIAAFTGYSPVWRRAVKSGHKAVIAYNSIQQASKSGAYRNGGHNTGDILSVNWRHITDLVLAKGKTKEVYCCDIVVLIVLFWCFWRVKD